jgi:Fe-S-cluster containining protein
MIERGPWICYDGAMVRLSSNSLEQRPYFFDAGIRFQCQRCGACCTGEPGTIYVARDEIVSLAAHLHLTVEDFIQRYLYPFKDSYSIGEHADGRCFFFDRGCTVYPLRPRQCRTYPFWFSNLRSEDQWRQVRSECPGIGSGRLYNRDEILAVVRTTLCL